MIHSPPKAQKRASTSRCGGESARNLSSQEPDSRALHAGKLAALTKKRNQIDELLPNPLDNLVLIKSLFNEYLLKLEELHSACDSVELKSWLSPNLESINRFRKRVESVIHPAVEHEARSVRSKGSSRTVSSAKVKLAEKKAKIAAQKLALSKAKQIADEEHRIKLSLLDLQKKQKMLESLKMEAKNEEEELEARVLEKELDRMDLSDCDTVLSESEVKGSKMSVKDVFSDTTAIMRILQRQNEISNNLVTSQERSLLPKKDIQTFDGTDVTKFSSFLLNFERAIEQKCETDCDRIIYLEQYTTGKARKLVQSCSHFEASVGYKRAKALLKKEYGDEFLVANSYIYKLQNWPSIKAEDSAALEELSIYLLNCSHFMENMSVCNQLQSPQELMNIVRKLPYRMRERWRRRTHSIQKNGDIVTLAALVDFVREESAVMRQPLFGAIAGSSPVKERQSDKVRKTLSTMSSDVYSEMAANDRENPEKFASSDTFCDCCKKTNHKLESCFFFQKKSPDEKSQFLKERGICFGCLGKDHFLKNCPAPAICSFCGKNHPDVLHYHRRNEGQSSGRNVLTHSTRLREHTGDGQKIVCPVVPARVRVEGCSREIDVNVALDTCSTDCWVNEDLLTALGIPGTEKKINLTTMARKMDDVPVKVVHNVIISDLGGTFAITVPVVYTKPNKQWPFSKEDLPKPADIKDYQHLCDVPFNFTDARIDVLVGMNVPDLLKCKRIVEGNNGEPYASLHSLGWALNGPVERPKNHLSLRSRVEKFYEIEEDIQTYFGRDYEDNSDDFSWSKEELKWYEIVDSSIKKLPSGQYEIDLPFRDEDPRLPNNRQQVLARFKALEGRFKKKNNLFEEYNSFMNTMIARDFMAKVPEGELRTAEGKVWYLTHHAVYHKQKHKLRIVFDCSLKYCGTSLNDKLMQGPDFANNLLGVLFRYRQGLYAFTADVEKMFYQVKVPLKQADFLRLFWYNESCEICEYRLNVHVFGAISSPSIANFALQQTARDDTMHSLEAKKTVLKDFYVDDLCKSTDTVEKALDLAVQVKEIVSTGNFNLTSFCSNSRYLLRSLPAESLSSKIKNLDLGGSLVADKTLGVMWDPEEDTLSFSLNFQAPSDPTRREILRTMASIYDPLGLVAPVLIPAKRIFQETCRASLSWDEKIPSALNASWKLWVESVRELGKYKVQRCVKIEENPTSIELHTFCDGSETAYGAVAYLVCKGETSETALLFAKARVTPVNNSTLKTIPRIELCSAKLAVETANKVKRELDLEINREFFWSDSITVLRYIKNDTSRFRRFVANKVAYILNFSSAINWYYVPSVENPADILSRGADVQTLRDSVLWNSGPRFLQDCDSFPEQVYVETLGENDEELSSKTKNLSSVVPDLSPVDSLLSSSSCWFRIRLRVAWVLRFKRKLCGSLKSPSANGITIGELEESETAIIKYIQKKFYSEEIKILKLNKCLPRNSSLHKLNPFICDSGILRVGGRLGNSDQTFDFRHPVILPGNSSVVESIVYHAHHKVGHLGRKSILANLRSKFWIIRGNTLARKICRTCFFCRKTQAKPNQQLMAELPVARVTGDKPAFTDVGIDYFGPFEVKHGRKSEKKYGVIFTCLASRAIHLEIAETMSTDSFINALRRFVCRRGNLKCIISDNGTNFVGACNELRREISEWNKQKLLKWFQQKNIDWKFNPPAASHFGGVWERLIRSVRKVFASLFAHQNIRLGHEELSTLMCEVESILNSRPLTEVSGDASDSEVLTPNHLLLLSSGVTFPPGLFSAHDVYAKRRWKQVQYLANLFWTRWRREYLAFLQERQKWTTKRESLQIGDLVLVMDHQFPRNKWPIGRVSNKYPDRNGDVRSVDLIIARNKESKNTTLDTTTIKRPITKLILLRSVEELA